MPLVNIGYSYTNYKLETHWSHYTVINCQTKFFSKVLQTLTKTSQPQKISTIVFVVSNWFYFAY